MVAEPDEEPLLLAEPVEDTVPVTVAAAEAEPLVEEEPVEDAEAEEVNVIGSPVRVLLADADAVAEVRAVAEETDEAEAEAEELAEPVAEAEPAEEPETAADAEEVAEDAVVPVSEAVALVEEVAEEDVVADCVAMGLAVSDAVAVAEYVVGGWQPERGASATPRYSKPDPEVASWAHVTRVYRSKGFSDWKRVKRVTANRRYFEASKATARTPPKYSEEEAARLAAEMARMLSGVPQ